MNTNSHLLPSDDDRDDPLTQLLHGLDRETRDPSPSTLDRLQQRAAAEFATSPADSPRAASTRAQEKPPVSRGRSWLVVGVVSALLLALVQLTNSVRADVTLGTVLDQLAAAPSLQLRLSRDGAASEILVRNAAQLRSDDAPGKYRIASGTRLWKIDEAENTVTSTGSPWFDAEREQIDLLRLLELEPETAKVFRQSIGSAGTDLSGRPARVFRLDLAQDKSPLELEAYADPVSGELRSICAWRGPARNGPPAAELTLVARNVAVDDSKFLVATSLSEDGRIGLIGDAQGIVTLRPLSSQRWTPVMQRMLLKPGDWIRANARGANAARLDLMSGFRITLGPGSLLEMQGLGKVKLHTGEVFLDGETTTAGKLELIPGSGQAVALESGKKVHYRLSADGSLREVTVPPPWLSAFTGASSNESLGSLICQVDGRDVPLTVGIHKVSVEIRDQIARTTIEETFVNHTNSQLEGIFHFPLPQDASISGFGMWINGELIEADVVEKQRAREIYETILREKRDPGLLEWAGGNIFKARVFPIFPHSEKRIKIVYTQVLPLRGNQYRYSYSLRSELLRKTPLRELSLNVLVSSALPLKKVHSSTHEVRTQLTPHSAELSFAAQEYSPDKDFEVVCEVDSRQGDVVMIPHQRGTDGYFLAQINPPSQAGNWQREMLTDETPLDLLLICDTSGSMDSEKRRQQAQFVGSILSSLGPKDTFQLAVCDVDCLWHSNEKLSATEENCAKAQLWLAERKSLGWTNLDKLAEKVLPRVREGAQVIYVGDGIVTAGDASPQAFVNRWERATANLKGVTFHAVSVGNSFESVVLNALARVGGGSSRQMGGVLTPPRAAAELLKEITQPGLKNLRIEFRGVEVAALYPDRLPNLPAGTQQILMGRYLPTGKNQSGEIIISGELKGQPVRYAARVSFAEAEAGNSFIPRLWARGHLDHLLAQGGSQAIQDEVISLSEEFHIITPYTSLLVLETDADRERFGVKRRFQMRDGEKFFAEGRDQSRFDLLQQQMKSAGEWRIGLRNDLLTNLSRLGRDPQMFDLNRQSNRRDRSSRWKDEYQSVGGFGLKASGPAGLSSLSDSSEFESLLLLSDSSSPFPLSDLAKESEVSQPRAELQRLLSDEVSRDKELGFAFDAREAKLDSSPLAGENRKLRLDLPALQQKLSEAWGKSAGYKANFFQDGLSEIWDRFPLSEQAAEKPMSYTRRISGGVLSPGQWLSQLLPSVPDPSPNPQPVNPLWTGEALEISRSLVQPPQLTAGGLEILRHSVSRDPAWDRITSESHQTDLYASNRWLSFSSLQGNATQVQWADERERGILSRPLGLGRVRPSVPRDVTTFTPGQRIFADHPLHQSYQYYTAEVSRPAEGRIVLVLAHPREPGVTSRFTVDSQRKVILEFASLQAEKVTSFTRYSEYTQVAGVWWPGKIETFNERQQISNTITQTVQLLEDPQFANRYAAELAGRESAVMAPQQLPRVKEAEAAVARGSAGLEHRLVLLSREVVNQQWDKALQELAAVELLAPQRPGIRWIRAAVLRSARQNDQLRQLLEASADELSAGPRPDDLFLAEHILNQFQSASDYNEMLRLLDRLHPVYQRQTESRSAEFTWSRRHLQYLRYLGRTEEFQGKQRSLAEAAPWDVNAQTAYAQDLLNAGDRAAALAWLERETNRNPLRQTYEFSQLFTLWAHTLSHGGEVEQALAVLRRWIELQPGDVTARQQYLFALYSANRVADAERVADEWLAAARVEGPLPPDRLAQLNAAVRYALGQRENESLSFIEPRWLAPLEQTGQFFLTRPANISVVASILGNSYFSESDQAQRLRREAGRILQEQCGTLRSAHMSQLLEFSLNYSILPQSDWETISQTLRQRWDAEADLSSRDGLDSLLQRIYGRHFADTQLLPFLRRRVARSIEEDHAERVSTARADLLQQLLSRSWIAEQESESLQLIPLLGVPGEPSMRLFAQVGALHRWVDSMAAARQELSMTQLQETDHPEQLTRTELAAKTREFRTAAQAGVAQSLAQFLEAAPEDAGNDAVRREWLAWARLEQRTLDVQLERSLEEAAREFLTQMGTAPAQPPELSDEFTQEEREALRWTALVELRKDRAFNAASYMASLKNPPAGIRDSVEAYIAAGLGLPGDAAARWKQARFTWLVVQDRPDDLERELREWIRTDILPAPWQRLLARLLAERSRIDEAITLLESVEKSSSLSPADYRILADWYLVADRRTDQQRAQRGVFEQTPEDQLVNWLRQKQRPWTGTDAPLPTQLDEDVLLAFSALFHKGTRPENSIYELRNFYTACRDFRLLRMIPDVVTGRTSQQIYPLLESLRSNLLYEVRDEAVADELLARLREVRSGTSSPVDLRALDLLEAMTERWCADVFNQPGPHAAAAVAALKRAFDREWADGEIRQMADLLDQLGTISHPDLAAERLRQLRDLHSRTTPGTDDRLFIGWSLAHALFSSHTLQEEGLATIENAVREYTATHPQGWPAHANGPIFGQANLLQSARRYAAAEAVLTRQIEHPLNSQQRTAFIKQRNACHVAALRAGGETSLGSGPTLYRELLNHLYGQTAGLQEFALYEVEMSLLETIQAARELRLEGHQAGLREFAFVRLPALLPRLQNYAQGVIQQTATRVHEILGPRDGVAFLIDQLERAPARLMYSWQNPWNQHGYQLAQWFRELKGEVPDLEPRLLALVLEELRRDLRSRPHRSRHLYSRQSPWYWSEKADDFARVAEEILAEQPDSGKAATFIAQFFHYDLARPERGIAILLSAHERKLLEISQQIVLVDFLHGAGRHGESVPILQPIVREQPDEMLYRIRLLTAYHRSSRPDQARALLTETDSHFRRMGRWTESNISMLAMSCLDNSFFTESVGYYSEAIAMRQRSAANRGVGEGTLSGYYSAHSRAFTGLGKTREAVDAAAAGVVAWGPRADQRTWAINWLDTALRGAPDLQAFVADWDRSVSQTGQDSPLIRQRLGFLFAEKDSSAAAIQQLQIALELQSNDVKTHEKLIELYDAAGNSAAAVAQTLELLDLDPRNLKLAGKLAERLRNDPALSERALTNIVETAPLEAENHAALAEIRQQQNRWEDAVAEWEHVARLRALEPSGLLKLAAAQIQLKRVDQARETLRQLNAKQWPARFSNVRNEIDQLQRQLTN